MTRAPLVTCALIIQHHPVETLGGNFASVLAERGTSVETVPVYAGAPDYGLFAAPPVQDVGLIIALGGPMSANDDYPALRQERQYLRQAMQRDVPVFGICLGAQLMSVALGGVVRPTGGYQFGLRKIDVTAAGAADPVFGKIEIPLAPTLHGECFSIPDGAVKLAEGYMLCRDGRYRRINMAFRCGNSYGFQFEPQLTLADLEVWDRELSGDYRLMGNRFDPAEEAARNLREFARYAPLYQAQMREMLCAFLDNAGVV